jgi:arylsulfatase A-like enzyme
MKTLLLLLPLTLAFPGCAPAQQDARPNVLFLFADDQRADTIGAHGNAHVRTPAIDSLVERGFSFRSNYCMGSNGGAVCVPSRAMLMSGRGLFRAQGDLARMRTLPMVLGEAGYQTFGTGKWHNGERSFDASFQAGKSVFFGGMCDHTEVLVRDKPEGGELSAKRAGGAFSSELFADAAVEFLSARRGDERPFFLYVAFSAPHDPRQPPAAWREHYYAHRPPLPANYMPLHPFHNGWMDGRDEQLAPWPRTREVIGDQLCEYYGMISHMDEQVARILAALETSGAAENTLVVFTADHGLALGSHGLLGKQNLYEHSMKCPLVLAGPRIARGSSAALTYLIDLFPTLCAATGVAPPDGLEGRDLLPVVRGAEAAVRTQLFTAYEDKMRALRDERWKVIRYPRLNHTQLFDLAQDPHELVDLAPQAEHAERVARMLADIAVWQSRLGDEQPLETDDPAPLEYDPRGWERAPDRWQPAWIREKYFGD